MGLYSSLILIFGLLLGLIMRSLGLTTRAQVKARAEAKRVILYAPLDETSQSPVKALQSSYRSMQHIFYSTSSTSMYPCLLIKNKVISSAVEIPPFVVDKLSEVENGLEGLTLLELHPKRYASVVLPGASYLAQFINTRRAFRCLLNWGCYNIGIFYTKTRVIAIADPELFEKTL